MRGNITALLAAFLMGAWVLPSVTMGGPPIYQVRQNVVALWKSLEKTVPHVSAREFKKIMDSGEEYVLLDVREEAEYNAGHLPGAINISRGMLEWETPDTIQNTDTKIYVYCLTGIRSLFAAQRLTEIGYTHVTNIADSFKGWEAAGYPVYNQNGEFVMSPGGFDKNK